MNHDHFAQQLPDYEDFKLIGQGSFGTVYRAKSKETNQVCAIKIVANRPDEMDRWEKDVEPMTLNHPSICKVLDTYVWKESYCVVMPLYNSNLTKLIYGVPERTNLNPGTKIDPILAWKMFHQLVEGINYMHGRGFAHRDLKPENVLLDNDNNAVLCDFGLSKRFTTLSAAQFRTLATPAYHAPEILKALNTSRNQPTVEYGPAVDYFSLGVIFYEMMVGQLPYHVDGHRTLSPERAELICKIDRVAGRYIEGLMSNDHDTRTKMFNQIVKEMRSSLDDVGSNPSPYHFYKKQLTEQGCSPLSVISHKKYGGHTGKLTENLMHISTVPVIKHSPRITPNSREKMVTKQQTISIHFVDEDDVERVTSVLQLMFNSVQQTGKSDFRNFSCLEFLVNYTSNEHSATLDQLVRNGMASSVDCSLLNYPFIKGKADPFPEYVFEVVLHPYLRYSSIIQAINVSRVGKKHRFYLLNERRLLIMTSNYGDQSTGSSFSIRLNGQKIKLTIMYRHQYNPLSPIPVLFNDEEASVDLVRDTFSCVDGLYDPSLNLELLSLYSDRRYFSLKHCLFINCVSQAHTFYCIEKGRYFTSDGDRKHLKLQSIRNSTYSFPQLVQSVSGTQLPQLHFNDNTFCLQEQDCLECITQWMPLNDKKVGVLCMGSPDSPGGEYLSGSNSQESSLFRRTTLMAGFAGENCPSRIHSSNQSVPYPWDSNNIDVVVTEGVEVIKSTEVDGLRPLPSPFEIVVLTSSAPKHPAIRKHFKFGQDFAKLDDLELLYKRWTSVFLAAIKHGITHLVICPLGCGVLKNPIQGSMEALKSLLMVFSPYFRSICFSAFENFSEFSSLLKPELPLPSRPPQMFHELFLLPFFTPGLGLSRILPCCKKGSKCGKFKNILSHQAFFSHQSSTDLVLDSADEPISFELSAYKVLKSPFRVTFHSAPFSTIDVAVSFEGRGNFSGFCVCFRAGNVLVYNCPIPTDNTAPCSIQQLCRDGADNSIPVEHSISLSKSGNDYYLEVELIGHYNARAMLNLSPQTEQICKLHLSSIDSAAVLGLKYSS
ncbi:hypothetical protein P9112_013140 [Eukaryota sp. TZLM1-RC]